MLGYFLYWRKGIQLQHTPVHTVFSSDCKLFAIPFIVSWNSSACSNITTQKSIVTIVNKHFMYISDLVLGPVSGH